MFYAVSACAAPEAGGGIYVYSLSDEGKISLVSSFLCDRPMYTARSGEKIHVLLRDGGDGQSVLVSATVCGGILRDPTAPISTEGAVACHLTAQDDEIYAVNYLSGNVIKFGGKTVRFDRTGPNAARQEMSHTHQVILSPGGKHVLVTDLGGDAITVFDRDLNICSEVFVPAGSGCRHLVFSPDGNTLFCANELSATVSVFTWQNSALTYLHDVSSDVPPALLPKTTAAAIRISADGKRLYLSNRGEDTLILFEITNGTHLTLSQKISCGGAYPRDFILTSDERHLICTNERSDNVTVFSLENGRIGHMTDRISLPAPLCVMEL